MKKPLNDKNVSKHETIIKADGADKMICDLHTHSVYSDGTLTPAQIIAEAQRLCIAAVALCDHNTVSGLDEFVSAAQNTKVTAVPGVEFSTEYEGGQLHILGLFIKRQCYGEITRIMNESQRLKEQSNIMLVERLCKSGYRLDYNKIKSQTPDNLVNRAHIAAALVQQGYVGSVDEAFKTLLHSKFGFYVPPKRPSALDIISKIKELGSVAVLAHPFLNLNEQRLREFLHKAIERGLDGMEAYYSLFDENTTRLAEKICDEYNILKSGGSDFHGANKPDISLGSGKGNLHIPFEIYEKLYDTKLK